MSVAGGRAIDVRALGALDVRMDGEQVAIPGAKPRAVLTFLALNPGQVIAADVLEAALWGEHVPRTARKALMTHISVLRRVLGEDAIETHGNGWRLAVEGTDASDFESAAAAGRRAQERGAPDEAAAALTAALRLWRGPPELPATPRTRAEITRWVEAHGSVCDERMEALLACGKAAELIGELEAAVADAPLRERRWAQLCLALYRAGRQGDALRAYQRARAVMSDELGVDPGPELRWLEAAVLAHDPGLDRPQDKARERPHDGAHERSHGDHRELSQARPQFPAPMATTRPAVSETLAPETLPRVATAFVGRAAELSALEDLMTSHRMVTVTGPGGVGKTRLAIAAATTYWRGREGGVAFVDLVPATPELIVQAVAAALGIEETPSLPLADAITDLLGSDPWLLVLDNCEHVIDAAGRFVASLLSASPLVSVLATSRERLGVMGEQVFAAPPMSLVGPGTGGPKGSDATTLFIDRARAVEPDFDADLDVVGQVCERLDGLPLAIELAAARCASLGVDGLLAGLDDRLGLLAGARGTADRHGSLRGMLEWSHELLDPDERTVFRRIGVFVGGFDLMAAAGVAHGAVEGPKLVSVIGRLVDKSLLNHERRAGGSRWQLLEVVRQFALEHLAASNDRAEVAQNYVQWAITTATQLERWLDTGEPWRDRFDLVADDLRSALLSSAAEDDHRHGLALALVLARLYERRGAFTIAESTYGTAMSMARTTGQADQIARAALGASMSGMLFGVVQARRVSMLEEALVAQPDQPSRPRARLLARLATELYWSDDRSRSLELAREAVADAEALVDDGTLAHALYALHYVTRGPESSADRLTLTEQIMSLAHTSGETQLELAGRAAYLVSLLESGAIEQMDTDLIELEELANRLEHPEFQWYAAVYRLVRALISGRFDRADDLAAAAADAAEYAPEFSVGLFFAEAVTDLRPLDDAGRRRRMLELDEMADRYPKVFIWRCLATLLSASSGNASLGGSTRVRVRDLTRQLLEQEIRDGHWLVGCCLVAEAIAALDLRAEQGSEGHQADRPAGTALATELAEALRPYADHLAVAGRVAAFRGSPLHALGLLALAKGESGAAIADLDRAARIHGAVGARPFQARSLAALAVALTTRGGPGDSDRAESARAQAERIAAAVGFANMDSSPP